MFLKVFRAFRGFVNNNLNTVLIVSIVAGLGIPGLELIPDIYVPYILGVMVFFLCAKISIQEIHGLTISEIVVFYIFRFILFPIILYYLTLFVYPKFAMGILLIALMPVGVTTPALVGVLNGSVALAFVLTISSSLLAPFVIPITFLITDKSTTIEVASLSYTLFSVIFIPAVVYILLLRLKPSSAHAVKNNSSFMTILLLGIIIAVVISKQREAFFSDFSLLFDSIIFCSLLFFFLYAFGWLYQWKKSRGKIITYSLCSGANNNALAISLALIYFPSEIIFFVIISELLWVLAIPAFNGVQKRIFKLGLLDVNPP